MSYEFEVFKGGESIVRISHPSDRDLILQDAIAMTEREPGRRLFEVTYERGQRKLTPIKLF